MRLSQPTKYRLLGLIVLAVALFYNQIILPSVPLYLPKDRDYILEETVASPANVLSTVEPWVTRDVGNQPANRPCQISIQLGVRAVDENSDSNTAPTQRIGLYAINELGERQQLGETEVVSGEPQIFDRVIVPTARFRWVQLELLTQDEAYLVDVDRFEVEPLETSSLAESIPLQPTIVGSITATRQRINPEMTDRGLLIKMKDDQAIVGLNLQLRRHGNGGTGPYQVEIKDAADAKVVGISGFIVAGHKSIVLLPDKSTVWQFPLSVVLQAGHSYLVNVNPVGASVSWLNRLELMDYLDIYPATANLVAGHQLLFGAVVQDLGGGHGLYTYESSERANRLNPPIVNAQEGYYEYAIDTLYPIAKMTIEAVYPYRPDQPRITAVSDNGALAESQDTIDYVAGTRVSRLTFSGTGQQRLKVRVYPARGDLFDRPNLKVRATLKMP